MVMTQELDRGYVCPSMSLNQSEGSGSILFSLTGSLPPLKQDSKILTSCTHLGKCVESVSHSSHYPLQLSILEIEKVYTMMEILINLEPLGL